MNKLLLLFFFCFFLAPTQNERDAFRPGKDFALFIAVSDYDQWQDLRNPVTDAEAVAKELEDNYGFSTEILKNPERSEIYNILDQYRQMTFEDDAQLFIFISGHGDFREESTEGFFIPKDGQLDDPFQDSYIPHTRLERMIDNIPCEHIFLALDACFSGTFDEDIALSRGPSFNRPGADQQSETDFFIKRKMAYRSRLYLTSGGKERTPDGKVYSPFTTRLLEGLRDYGGDDNLLTFNELLSYMEKAVPIPRSGSFGSHEPGGDFLFIAGPENLVEKNETKETIQEEQPVVQDENEVKAEEKPVKKEESKSGIEYGEVKTSDGNKIKTIKIGDKTWLAENLNIKTAKDSWCYDEDENNCDQYGRLYLQSSAMAACSSLGTGWHLPTYEEWHELLEFFGDGQAAYNALIEGGSSGFKAQLGGVLEYGYDYALLDEWGLYITSSVDRKNDPIVFSFSKPKKNMAWTVGSKSRKYSCRCVK